MEKLVEINKCMSKSRDYVRHQDIFTSYQLQYQSLALYNSDDIRQNKSMRTHYTYVWFYKIYFSQGKYITFQLRKPENTKGLISSCGYIYGRDNFCISSSSPFFLATSHLLSLRSLQQKGMNLQLYHPGETTTSTLTVGSQTVKMVTVTSLTHSAV